MRLRNLAISGGKTREHEQDVVKVWKAGGLTLCLMGWILMFRFFAKASIYWPWRISSGEREIILSYK